MRICIYGAASDAIADDYKVKTEELSSILARRGHSLVFGAGGTGLMGAVARGFRKEGQQVIGVIPQFFIDEGIEAIFNSDVLLTTDTMAIRKAITIANSDAFIITPGGVGTMDEFFQVITDKQLRLINKQIAIYNINGFFDDVLKFMQRAMNEKFARRNMFNLYKAFNENEVSELIAYIETPVEDIQEEVEHNYGL